MLDGMNNSLAAIIAGIILLVVAFFAFNAYIYNEKQGDPQEVQPVVTEENQPHIVPPITLTERTVTFEDETQATFQVPEEFELAVATEGLGKVRFMSLSPDGRIFVPDLVDYRLSRAGRVLILDNFNEDTKQFETTETYLSGLRGPNSLAFYTDENGQEWLYLALTAHLVRYPYQAGDTEPSGEPEILFEFPNTISETADSVVWHITRTIKFEGDRLYVAIGSGCNSCEQDTDELRAMIASMNPDGSDARVYADGLRNSVDFTFADGTMYTTANGADHLQLRPNEALYRVVEGQHYGWPYCFIENGVVVDDTTQEWEREFSCDDAPRPLAYFDPRSAPLGVTYFSDVHDTLLETFLVALHGSFDATVQNGYELVRVTKEGEHEVFMSGFLNEEGERVARPVHVLQKDADSFFLTDDHGGRVFYVYAR